MKAGKRNGKRLCLLRRRKRRLFLRKHPGELLAEIRRWTVEYEHGPVYEQSKAESGS